jgi:hypothetical protein
VILPSLAWRLEKLIPSNNSLLDFQ